MCNTSNSHLGSWNGGKIEPSYLNKWRLWTGGLHINEEMWTPTISSHLDLGTESRAKGFHQLHDNSNLNYQQLPMWNWAENQLNQELDAKTTELRTERNLLMALRNGEKDRTQKDLRVPFLFLIASKCYQKFTLDSISTTKSVLKKIQVCQCKDLTDPFQ